MKLEIVWHPAALNQFFALGWHAAESVDAAVIRLAATGRGDVEWVAPYYRLRVGVYRVRFTVDRDACVLTVISLYGAG
jgi:mRNA-degrading endonuclease RelE of RelBE toxin-antitoxin system